MNVILFDDQSWGNLLPLTYTRPVSELRIGIYTITQKWNIRLGVNCSFSTQDYLKDKYPMSPEPMNLMINGSVLPDKELVEAIRKLDEKQVLLADGIIIAAHVPAEKITDFLNGRFKHPLELNYKGTVLHVSYPWDLFRLNGKALEMDFRLVGAGRNSATLSSTNSVTGKYIFVEDGAIVEHAILNTSTGPIYIGKDTEIMEGSLIRGPFALMEGSVVKMGTRVYGPTTIGPGCKVGGEITNSIMIANSNKAHEGYLGNSVLGEWVNIGADTNASNLKNNYENVKAWNEPLSKFIPTGQQFCGLIMGDHSKCGINTMFNTGTVVGVSCNIFGSGYPRNYIPSFSWGGPHGYTEFSFEKAIHLAELVVARRKLKLSLADRKILKEVFDRTASKRSY
jgi:UDP-N-acetylglucosamine diphosphorylase/glucosamine-1-phosphate N-acetyltransferase